MHRSIRDRLEDLLSGERSAGKSRQAIEHLAACEQCSSELATMRQQAALLRSLCAPAEVEPAPGFYARVMQRIEERAKDSIWAVFLDSFGKRLAYGSLGIVIALGTYLITAELHDGHLGEPVVAQQYFNGSGTTVTGDLNERRNAVLLNFASYQPDRQSLQQGSLQ